MSVLGINSAESFSHLFGCHTYLTLGINIGCYLKYHHGTESGREALRLSVYCQTDMYCICRFMGRGEKVVLTCKCVFVKVKPQQLLNKLSSCVYCLCGTRNSVLCFRIQALTMVYNLRNMRFQIPAWNFLSNPNKEFFSKGIQLTNRRIAALKITVLRIPEL